MSTRCGHLVPLAPLLAAGCVGAGHAGTAASAVSTPANTPVAPAKVVLVAIPPVKRRYPGDPPPRGASLPVRLYDVTEHSFGPGTLELLCRIVASLRPAPRAP